MQLSLSPLYCTQTTPKGLLRCFCICCRVRSPPAWQPRQCFHALLVLLLLGWLMLQLSLCAEDPHMAPKTTGRRTADHSSAESETGPRKRSGDQASPLVCRNCCSLLRIHQVLKRLLVSLLVLASWGKLLRLLLPLLFVLRLLHFELVELHRRDLADTTPHGSVRLADLLGVPHNHHQARSSCSMIPPLGDEANRRHPQRPTVLPRMLAISPPHLMSNTCVR